MRHMLLLLGLLLGGYFVWYYLNNRDKVMATILMKRHTVAVVAIVFFALFFLGEYAAMILMSGMTSVLFLGGWHSPLPCAPFTWVPGPIWFSLKIAFCLFVFLWVRATFPRYRYDQLMRLGWKVFLPLSLAWVVLTAAVLQFGGWVPKL